MGDDPAKTETDEQAESVERAWEELFGSAQTTGLAFATEQTFHRAYEERQAAEGVRQLLAFRVAAEEYAVDLHEVQEILKVRPVTPVPRTKDFLAGVIAVRGVVMPVVDLGIRLGLGPVEPSANARILVVENRDQRFGLVVDRVIGVERSAELRVEPPPGVIGGPEADFVQGIGKIGNKMFILLRLDAVLDFEAAA